MQQITSKLTAQHSDNGNIHPSKCRGVDMITKLLLAVPMTVALATSGTAHASASQVNFGFIPFSAGIIYDGATLGTSTSLSFLDPTLFSTNTVQNMGPFKDDSGAFLTMPVDLSKDLNNNVTFNYMIGAVTPFDLVKTFTTGSGGAPGSQGLYTATFTSIFAQSSDPDFLDLTIEGTIVGPDGFSSDDLLLANCNQSGGPGNVVNCSFTEQAPTTDVPEPGSLMLLSLSLVGLRIARKRTHKKTAILAKR